MYQEARGYIHLHTCIPTPMFASIVITTPQGSIILYFVYENSQLSINEESPTFQCVKSVYITSFSGPYFTTLGLNTEIYRIGKLFDNCFPSCKTIDCFHPAFDCLNSTMETQKQCEKSVQS